MGHSHDALWPSHLPPTSPSPPGVLLALRFEPVGHAQAEPRLGPKLYGQIFASSVNAMTHQVGYDIGLMVRIELLSVAAVLLLRMKRVRPEFQSEQAPTVTPSSPRPSEASQSCRQTKS